MGRGRTFGVKPLNNSDGDKIIYLKGMSNIFSLTDFSPESAEVSKKNSYLIDFFLVLILAMGLSSVYSSFLQAAKRALELESDDGLRSAMSEFVDIGSSLNERYVTRVSQD